jgi:predicted  nucleic acid-binding Zn-ribbon protein
MFHICIDTERATRDYDLKLTERDMQIEKLVREKQNAEERYKQVKDQLLDSQGFENKDADIDQISSARHKIIALQEELGAQTNYSNNLISVINLI